MSKIKAVEILISPYPEVFILNSKFNFLNTDAPVDLKALPVGGIFSGPGVENNKFYPNLVGIGGPYPIIYTYTSPYQCKSSEQVRFTVNKDFALVKSDIKAVGISLFPNPAKDEMVLRLDLKESKSVEVNLYNSLGQKTVFFSSRLPSTQFDYVINKHNLGLSSGIYFIEVKSGSERSILRAIFE